jgi:hypothetical protein
MISHSGPRSGASIPALGLSPVGAKSHLLEPRMPGAHPIL